jgi:hypothetical protein
MTRGKPPRVDGFRFGRITIDGKDYRRDMIIFPDGVDLTWSREASHLLDKADLNAVFDRGLQALIVGTGVFGSMAVAPAALESLRAAQVEVLLLRSGAACEEYNRRRVQQSTVLAIHLTC